MRQQLVKGNYTKRYKNSLTLEVFKGVVVSEKIPKGMRGCLD